MGIGGKTMVNVVAEKTWKDNSVFIIVKYKIVMRIRNFGVQK